MPPIIEKNDFHNGINIVGSTSILNNFHIINDIYSFKQKITSEEIKSHLKYLIQTNPKKKVIAFLDNAKIHTSRAIQEFYSKENVWNYLKAKLFKSASRSSIEELAYAKKFLV